MDWRWYVRVCAAGLLLWFLCFLCYVIAWEIVRTVFG